MTSSTPIRLLIVDDHPIVREGLRAAFNAPGFVVVGEAGDGDEGVTLAARVKPDVVLMDLRMPRTDGVTAIRRLRQSDHPPPVLVLTTFDGDADVLPAIEAGAVGYLLKDAPTADLLAAVHTVAGGGSVLSPDHGRPADRTSPQARPGHPEPTRAGRAEAARGRRLQPCGGGSPLHQRGHHQDAPRAHLRQARGSRPGGRCRRGLPPRPPRMRAEKVPPPPALGASRPNS